MPRMMRLPTPGSDYSSDWANQYTRMLEAENSNLWNAIVTATGLTVGTTAITSGTTTRVLFDNAGVLGEYVISGSGNVAMTTSPTFVTPVLGTPTSGTLTNTTGFPTANLAGAGAGILTFLATPSSANLAAAVTNETGSGLLVFDTAPTLSNPVVGTQSAFDNSTKAASTAYADRIAVQQVVSTITGAVATGTTTIPFDDTIPQNTEGDQYMSLAITPKSATSKLIIAVAMNASNNAGGGIGMTAALFQDSTANAVAVAWGTIHAATYPVCVAFCYTMTSGTTSATTFKVRGGSNAVGTTTFNGQNGTRIYGGALASSIIIMEVGS